MYGTRRPTQRAPRNRARPQQRRLPSTPDDDEYDRTRDSEESDPYGPHVPTTFDRHAPVSCGPSCAPPVPAAQACPWGPLWAPGTWAPSSCAPNPWAAQLYLPWTPTTAPWPVVNACGVRGWCGPMVAAPVATPVGPCVFAPPLAPRSIAGAAGNWC